VAIVRPVDGRRLRLALFFSGIVKHDESDAANLCLVRSRAQSGFSSLAAQKTPDCTSWHTHWTLLHNLVQSPETTMVKSWEMTDKRHLGSPRYDVESAVRQALSRGASQSGISCSTRLEGCPSRGIVSSLELSTWQHGEQEKGPGLFSKRPRLSQHHVPVRKGKPGSRSQSKCKEKAFQKEICAEINRIAAQIVRN